MAAKADLLFFRLNADILYKKGNLFIMSSVKALLKLNRHRLGRGRFFIRRVVKLCSVYIFMIIPDADSVNSLCGNSCVTIDFAIVLPEVREKDIHGKVKRI